MTPDFVAPASGFNGVLHIRDKSRAAALETLTQGATYGSTICGKAMRAKDGWQLLEQEPGDSVCAKCEAGNIGEKKTGWR